MDAYRYGGKSMGGAENLAGADRGLLDRPNRNYSQRNEIGKAYTELDNYNATDDYNKNANRVIYSYDYNGLPSNKPPKIGDTYNKDVFRGRYTEDAQANVLKGLQDTQKKHGVLQVKKLDRASVGRELSKAKADKGYAPSWRGDPYMDMYKSMATYTYKETKEESDEGGYLNKWVDSGGAHSRYIKELEDILADPNDRYASFWSHSKKEYGEGYRNLSNSLKKASSDFKTNYIKSNEASIQGQREQLADMEKVNSNRVAKRNEVYSKLFNHNKDKKRYL